MTEPKAAFSPATVLTHEHDLSRFASGESALDQWLRERALDNQALGASRTYVVCEQKQSRVAGYYALAMGGILGHEVPGSMRRNMPKTIPAVILARLAIDRDFQGRGLGAALLLDSIERSLRAIAEVSARLLLVHAISPEAEAFYKHFGFKRLPVEAPTLALDLIKFEMVRSKEAP